MAERATLDEAAPLRRQGAVSQSHPVVGRVRVAVWSHDRIVTEALAATLAARPGLVPVDLVTEGPPGGERPATPNVVLVDVSGDRAAALRWLLLAGERFSGAQLVAMGVASEAEVLDLVEAGAVGYVLASATPSALAAAVRAAADGQARCSDGVLADLCARVRQLGGALAAAEPQVAAAPTRRQVEILELLAEGLSNKQIAQRLRISRQTAKNHVHRLLASLGAHGRREAVRIAYQSRILRGLLPPLAVGADRRPGGRPFLAPGSIARADPRTIACESGDVSTRGEGTVWTKR